MTDAAHPPRPQVRRGRRAKGEGSVRQRADGRWEGRITLPDGRRRSVYAPTQRAVLARLRRLREQAELGVLSAPGPGPGTVTGGRRRTVGQFLEEWLATVVRPTCRPRTYRSYADVVRLHLIPTLGKVPLDLSHLTPPRIAALLHHKQAEGLSPRTVTYIRDVLSRALNHAVRWGWLPKNPAPLAPAPRQERRPVRVLTPDEARRLLAAVRDDRLGALYTVALALGLRKGEALGLSWADVDLDAGTLTVRGQLQRLGGGVVRTEPKSAASRRTVYLPAVVAQALRAHRVRQREERLRAGPAWRGNPWDLVFTTPLGTPLDERNVTRQFQRALARAGLPPMRFHDLRHSAASLLLAQGVSAKLVQELLGHATIALTLGTYSHLIPQIARDTARRMHALLTDDTDDRPAEAGEGP